MLSPGNVHIRSHTVCIVKGQLALLFGEAGHFDEAFRHLDTAIEQRDPALVHLAVAPQWDHVRVDRRFDERLKQVGLFDTAERARHFISL